MAEKEQPEDHWRGMGHSRVVPGQPIEEEEGDGERSSVGSSSGSGGFDYLIKENGEVEPIGGGEEEEEEEGEEEGGGGPNFPPLPPNLDAVFKPHKELLFTNDPDLSESEWELGEYELPEGFTYLVIGYVCHDRSVNSSPGVPKFTLNGKAPDFVNSGDGVYAGAGTGGYRKRLGLVGWKAPENGPLVLKLTGFEESFKGQTYIIALPISVKGGINVAAGNVFTGQVGGSQAWSINLEASLPKAWITVSATSKEQLPEPSFLNTWSGYLIFGGRTASPTGNGKWGALEIQIGVVPTGPFSVSGIYPVMSNLYTANNYGGRAITHMNL